MTIRSVRGGARLTSPLTATLTIDPNDIPVTFASPIYTEVKEGNLANLTIQLNRALSEAVTVTYTTIDFTAVSSSGDFVSAVNQTVILSPGETRKSFTIQINNDTTPETNEQFYVDLVASSGDTVLTSPTRATIVILANDDSNGIFQFSESSLHTAAAEGQTLSLE